MTAFFEFQRQARKKSQQVIVAFILTLVVILIGYNLAIVFIFKTIPNLANVKPKTVSYNIDSHYQHAPVDSIWWLGEGEKDLYVQLLLLIMFAILFLGAYIYQHWQYKSNPQMLVQLMGAKFINYSMSNISLPEKQLLNIVDEMCIAAGIPLVKTFILTKEVGINAFTSGHDFKTAHIVVTQGLLDHLSRDEVQAVVAHEVGHIVSADVKVNMKLLSCIFSLSFMVWFGYKIFESQGKSRRSSSNNGTAQAFLFALVLIVVGYLGALAARVLQSMFSRQREYLADALGVQFTRNPTSLASALAKIRDWITGSKILAAESQNVSHMCIAESGFSGFWNDVWASHPPINERIRLLDPKFLQVDLLNQMIDSGSALSAETLITNAINLKKNKQKRQDEKQRKKILAELTMVGQLEVDANKAQLAAQKTKKNLMQAKLWEILQDQIDFKYCVWSIFLSQDIGIAQRQKQCLAQLYRIEFDLHRFNQCVLAMQKHKSFDHSFLELLGPIIVNTSAHDKNKLFSSIQDMIDLENNISIAQTLFYAGLYAFCFEPKKEHKVLKSKDVQNAFFTFSHLQPETVNQGFSLMSKAYYGVDFTSENLKILNPMEFADVLLSLQIKSLTYKQPFLQALWMYVQMDGELSRHEFENMRIISLCLGVSLPPLEAIILKSLNA